MVAHIGPEQFTTFTYKRDITRSINKPGFGNTNYVNIRSSQLLGFERLYGQS